MADEASKVDEATPAPAPPEGEAPAAEAPRLGRVWQVPALLLAAGLFAGGVVVAFLRAPKPDYGGTFAQAEGLAKEEKFGEAIAALNRDVLPHVAKGELSEEQRRKFHSLVGRYLYLGQKQAGVDRAENNEGIIEHLEQVEKLHGELEARDVGYLAESLVSLGKTGEALDRVRSLPDKERELKVSLRQRMVSRAMAGPVKDHSLALDLIGEILAGHETSADVRAWATARQGEILLEQGYAAEAITRLLRAMQRLDGADPRQLVSLRILLARGYIETEDFVQAAGQLSQAEKMLGESDPDMAEVLLLSARVAFNTDKPAAGERFAAVVERFPNSELALPALLGLAEVEALSGQYEEAYARYEELAERIESGEAHAEAGVGRVVASLLTNFRDRFETEDYAMASRYAELADRLSDRRHRPPEVLLALAQVNEKLGEEVLRTAYGDPSVSLAKADPATQSSARRHFVDAGIAYREHAGSVVLTDSTRYGRSLWSAAEMFDRAGDTQEAIEAFKLYVAGFPADAKLPEAKFRLAQAYQARGDLATAERLYEELMERRRGEGGSGPWGDASFVPLARVWLMDGKPGNDEQAEQMLLAALSGDLGGPGTTRYREALEELGGHYYRGGRAREAVERYSEYMERYGGGEGEKIEPRIEEIRFRLADAHRLAGKDLQKQVDAGGLPDSTRRQLRLDRAEHLRNAMALFEQSRRRLEAIPRRAELQDRYLRNSYYYLGETAFDLGEHDLAIRRYDEAKERYPRDPASLVAMVQIVSAYTEKGEFDKARTADERARRFFESLPDSAWDDPNLPMDRRAWERWLESSTALRSASGQGAGGHGEDGGS